MYEKVIENIRNAGKALAESQSALNKILTEYSISVDQTKPIPETDYTAGEIDVSTSLLSDLLRNFDATSIGALVPRSQLEAVATKATETRNQIQALIEMFAPIKQAGGVTAFDQSTFNVTAKNGTQIGLAKAFKRIFPPWTARCPPMFCFAHHQEARLGLTSTNLYRQFTIATPNSNNIVKRRSA